MRLQSRLAKMEKVNAERRPPCPCPRVKVVSPEDLAATPRACSRCGKGWKIIVLPREMADAL